MWRKKSRIREEGYRRPQDALLAVQGVRPEEKHKPQHNPVYGLSHAAAAGAARAAGPQPFTLHSVDQTEREQVERLYNTLVAAKKKAGKMSPATSILSPPSCKRKPLRFANSITARASNSPSNSPTATSS